MIISGPLNCDILMIAGLRNLQKDGKLIEDSWIHIMEGFNKKTVLYGIFHKILFTPHFGSFLGDKLTPV